MKKADKKLYLYIGLTVLIVAVIGAASYFGSGATLQGSLGRVGKVGEKTTTEQATRGQAKVKVSNTNTATEQTTSDATYTISTTEQPTNDATYTISATEQPTNDATYTISATEQPANDATYTISATEQPANDAVYTISATEQPANDAVYTIVATEQTTGSGATSISATAAPLANAQIVRNSAGPNAIALYLSNLNLVSPDQYFATCWETYNENVFQLTRIDQPAGTGTILGITVGSLKPLTSYTCQAGVATPASTPGQYAISRNSGNVQITTSAL